MRSKVVISNVKASTRRTCRELTALVILLLGLSLLTYQALSHICGKRYKPIDPLSHSPIRAAETPKYVCAHGTPPWHDMNLRTELEHFNAVYAHRPGGMNDGGGAFFHYFAIWCTVKALKPEVIIESGIHNGVGSWFIRQAAGSSRLIFVSPEDPQIYRDKYEDTVYFTEKEFADFASIDWQHIIPSSSTRERSMIFFDDHQDCTERVKVARELGFGHVMFDDNYLPGFGDSLSVKMACEPSLHHLIEGKEKPFLYLDNFGKTRQEVSAEWFLLKRTELLQNIETYSEFPPVWDGPSRFNIPRDVWTRVTLPALFMKEEVQHLKVNHDEESRRYTHIVYLHLKSETEGVKSY